MSTAAAATVSVEQKTSTTLTDDVKMEYCLSFDQQEYIDLLMSGLFKITNWSGDKTQMDTLKKMFETVHSSKPRQQRQLHFASVAGKTWTLASFIVALCVFGKEHYSLVVSCFNKRTLEQEMRTIVNLLYKDFGVINPVTKNSETEWEVASKCSVRWMTHASYEKGLVIGPKDIVLIDDLCSSINPEFIKHASENARAIFSMCRDQLWQELPKSIKDILWQVETEKTKSLHPDLLTDFQLRGGLGRQEAESRNIHFDPIVTRLPVTIPTAGETKTATAAAETGVNQRTAEMLEKIKKDKLGFAPEPSVPAHEFNPIEFTPGSFQ